MAGTAGSSLNAELNRLAGTTGKADQGAANIYAGTTGLGLIAALNKKASAVRQPNAYKGLNAICNELASTTGKSAVTALQGISLVQTVYSIGDTGPGGGKVIYDAGSTLSWGRYIEVAPDTWSGGIDAMDFKFGINSPISGTLNAIGTSVTNTDLLIAQSSSTLYIGKSARNYTGGSKTNWQAPSPGDLNLCWLNVALMGTLNAFAYDYLSSQEWSGSTAFCNSQRMSTGALIHTSKNQATYMRPVRYFTNSTN